MAEETPLKEVAPPSEIWKNALGETLLITLAGAVLYFWGIMYYLQLSSSLGLGISLFSLSTYEIIVAPWDGAVMALSWAAGLWALWHQRHLFELIAYYLLVFPLRILWRLLTQSRFGDYLDEVKQKTPPALWPPAVLRTAFNDPARDRMMFHAGFHALLVLTILGMGFWSASKAGRWVADYESSTKNSTVEVQCADGSLIRGTYVIALGDAIVIDATLGEERRRILLKQSQLKRIDKILAPKAAQIAKEPSLPLSTVP